MAGRWLREGVPDMPQESVEGISEAATSEGEETWLSNSLACSTTVSDVTYVTQTTLLDGRASGFLTEVPEGFARPSYTWSARLTSLSENLSIRFGPSR